MMMRPRTRSIASMRDRDAAWASLTLIDASVTGKGFRIIQRKVLVVADGHARRRDYRFRGDEFRRISLKLLNPMSEIGIERRVRIAAPFNLSQSPVHNGSHGDGS